MRLVFHTEIPHELTLSLDEIMIMKDNLQSSAIFSPIGLVCSGIFICVNVVEEVGLALMVDSDRDSMIALHLTNTFRNMCTPEPSRADWTLR